MLLISFGIGTAALAQAVPQVSPALQQAVPQAPSSKTAEPVNPFPPVNLKNFTADSPTTADVDAFLKAIWGYDENRIWSIAAILKTKAPGVAKVIVYVADKTQPKKGTQTAFFITPDGKHAIADNVIDFGPKPFELDRTILQDRAAGPAEGAAGKDLLLVEFADLQDPRSKQAQETMNKLATDFPQARIVVENLALNEGHSLAMRAAAEGACLAKQKGNAAFFLYEQAVFDKQDILKQDSAESILGAAVTSAGGDPKAVAACAATPAGKAAVVAANTLAVDLGAEATPSLAVNGHFLPVDSVKYETLKKIIAYQAGQDGIVVHIQPTLSNIQ
jgi:protein-disulfide isomerase